MINELVQRLRDEMVEQSSRCGEEDSQDRALLAEEAANEIERLLKREKDLMDVIDSRDRALGFVPLDEVTSHEPFEQQLQLPGPRVTSEDSVWQSAESSRPRELLAQQMEPDTSPLTHQEIFSAVHHHAAEIVKLTAAVPAQCTQGASRDTSPELHAKGCPCPDCLNGTTRSNVEQFASRDASPADLVGALQDVVHTDTGPVRAGKAHRDAFSEFVCPNHGRVQQLTDSGDCPMCYQDRHAQRT